MNSYTRILAFKKSVKRIPNNKSTISQSHFDEWKIICTFVIGIIIFSLIVGASSAYNYFPKSSAFPTVRYSYQSSVGSKRPIFSILQTNEFGLNFSTYLGGNYSDVGNGIAVDTNGDIYVTGSTASSNFPMKDAYYSAISGGGDAFVAKIGSTGNLLFSTYLGGNVGDIGNGIAVDTNGNIYVTGIAGFNNFPTKDAYQPTFGGFNDAFVAKFSVIVIGSPFLDIFNPIFIFSITLVIIILLGLVIIFYFRRKKSSGSYSQDPNTPMSDEHYSKTVNTSESSQIFLSNTIEPKITLIEDIIKESYQAPDYETALKIQQGGFPDYNTFKQASDKGIITYTEWIKYQQEHSKI